MKTKLEAVWEEAHEGSCRLVRRQILAAAVISVLLGHSAHAGPGKVYPLDPAGNPDTTQAQINTFYANSPLLTKFKDTLPGLSGLALGPGYGPNNLGQYIPVASALPGLSTADILSYPGSDYYEIAILEYQEKMHSELQKATQLRGYVQIDRVATNANDGGVTKSPSSSAYPLVFMDGTPILVSKEKGWVTDSAGKTRWDHNIVRDTANNPVLVPAYGFDKPHYLGPTIVAMKDRAVRIKFNNLLKAGSAKLTNGKVASPLDRNGDYFIPTDHTLSGTEYVPDANSPSGFSNVQFRENRHILHLHGGSTPWISDGLPHQWIMPAADETLFRNGGVDATGKTIPPMPYYARGASTQNVPDMPDPGPGAATFYWTNRDSGRLMMYHDHVVGNTRLTPYVGIAAGYLIADDQENGLMRDVLGLNVAAPTVIDIVAAEGIPLVFQDKTWVPNDIAAQDSLWDQNAWGKPGDLWFPHVYETASATNPAGRWDWGPDFLDWPGSLSTNHMRDVNGNWTSSLPTGAYGDVSHVPESFMDSSVVNGTAYPTMTVDPKAYRFQVLSVGNDRTLNLGLYVAVDKNGKPCDGINDVPESTGIACTEVSMVPFDTTLPGAPAFPSRWGMPDKTGSTDRTADNLHPGGVPDPTTAGPDIHMFGTEAGIYDHVETIASTIVNYESIDDLLGLNGQTPPPPGGVNLGPTMWTVKERGLHLAPAERADIVIDFSQYAGKTLIVYNDSPAPSPGGDIRYDYYTGNADQTLFGGAPSTQRGKGPNTRTLMQIKVNKTRADGAPITAFATYTNGTLDANSGLGKLTTGLATAFAASQDPWASTSGNPSGAPIAAADICFSGSRPDGSACAIVQDAEGVTPDVSKATQIKLSDGKIYTAKEKTIFEDFDFLGRITATLGTWTPGNGVAAGAQHPQGYINPNTDTIADGRQEVWRITHNGVDMHPIHWHLVNMQILGRIGWDGTFRAPGQAELGWKDTVEVIPMMDTLVAIKPKNPKLPFGLPRSARLLDPAQPFGNSDRFTPVNPFTGQAAVFTNLYADFNWEYVWHCHILGHEENDLMRPMVLNYSATAAANVPVISATSVNASAGTVAVTWQDQTPGWNSAAPSPALAALATDMTNAANATTGDVAPSTDNEVGFRVERAPVVNSVVGTYAPLTTGLTSYIKGVTDATGKFGLDKLGNSLATYNVNALANATGYADTGVPANSAFSYRVVAVNAALDGAGNWIGEQASAPVGVTTPAVAVTGLTVSGITSSTAILSWSNPNPGTSTVAVKVLTASGAAVTGAKVTVTGSTAAISGLAGNTAYQFVATVTGMNGQPSPAVTVNATTTPAPLVYIYNTATRTVTLLWADVSAETSYTVQRQLGTINATSGAVTWGTATSVSLAANTITWTSPALNANALYKFTVTPVYPATAAAIGVGGSLTGSVIVPTATAIASAPNQMQVQQGLAGQMKVQWQASANTGLVTGYEIQRCKGTAAVCNAAAAVWQAASTPSVSGWNTTRITDTGLAAKTTYSYRVRAINSLIPTLLSNWSAVGAATTR